MRSQLFRQTNLFLCISLNTCCLTHCMLITRLTFSGQKTSSRSITFRKHVVLHGTYRNQEHLKTFPIYISLVTYVSSHLGEQGFVPEILYVCVCVQIYCVSFISKKKKNVRIHQLRNRVLTNVQRRKMRNEIISTKHTHEYLCSSAKRELSVRHNRLCIPDFRVIFLHGMNE